MTATPKGIQTLHLMMEQFLASSAVLCSIAWLVLRKTNSKTQYAPGPSGWPLVGNTFQVPKIKIWKYFENLSLIYGPVFRLSLAGDEILVLNDPADAEELLQKRSHNYSSRKPLVYAGHYQSQNKRLVLLPYGPELKTQRAAFYQMLQPRVIGSYERMQELESTKFVLDMLMRPSETAMNCKRYAASLVFTLSYGKRLADDDEDLKAVLDILDKFIQDCYPGAHLVDTFPFLDKVLPDFLAPWRAEAKKKHEDEMRLYQRLVLEVKQKIDAGRPEIECFVARLWEQQEKLNLDLTSLSYIAGSAFEAGTGTTAGTILWFLMAMVMHPGVLKHAQSEIDGVLGADGETMPAFEHLDALPYCIALTKEVFRWMPTAPGGFPHYSDHADEYHGFKIKANTMIIPCIWSMQHNPKMFPEPLRFDPERFLTDGRVISSGTDLFTDGHYGFGFGRRVCPGRYLGSRSVWLGITRLIWAFNIGPFLDNAGQPLSVDPERCTSGITSEPEPFPVSITPRSKTHSETIKSAWKCALAASS